MPTTYAKLSANVIDKAVQETIKRQGSTVMPEESSPFKQMLDQMNDGMEFARNLGMTANDIGFSFPTQGLDSISAAGIPIDEANLAIRHDSQSGIDKVVAILSDVNDGQMRMENLVNEILYGGKRFSNQELLAIQAHVFHVAQMTELAVKVADHGVSSTKAVLNTNIQ